MANNNKDYERLQNDFEQTEEPTTIDLIFDALFSGQYTGPGKGVAEAVEFNVAGEKIPFILSMN